MKISFLIGNKKSPNCGLSYYARSLIYAMHKTDIKTSLICENRLPQKLYKLVGKVKIWLGMVVNISITTRPATDIEADGYGNYLLEYAIRKREKYNRGIIVVNPSVPFDMVWAMMPQSSFMEISAPLKICTLHDIIPVSHPHLHFINKLGMNQGVHEHHKLYRQVLDEADIIACVSNYTRDQLLKHYPSTDPSKLAVTYQSIITENYTVSDDEARQALDKFNLINQKYFICVGWVNKRKNQLDLMQAYLRLETKMPLVLIGKFNLQDGEASQFNSLIKENIDRIIYLGEVDQVMLSALMKHARALLFPSKCEGFGIPILEAFYLKVPVLTSNKTATKEVAGDAAILVNPEDIESISQGIYKLATDDDLCQMLVEKGSQRYEYFSMDSYSRRLKQIFKLINKESEIEASSVA